MELGQEGGGRGRGGREGGGEWVEIGGVLREMGVVGSGEDGRKSTWHVQINKWMNYKEQRKI